MIFLNIKGMISVFGKWKGGVYLFYINIVLGIKVFI